MLGGTSPLFASMKFNDSMGLYCSNTSGACYNQTGTDFFSTMLNELGKWIFSVNGLLAIGIAGAVAIGLSAVTGNLNLLAIIPLALAFFIVQFALLPTSFITQSTLPVIVQLMLQAFFYILTILTLIGFMRTGN